MMMRAVGAPMSAARRTPSRSASERLVNLARQRKHITDGGGEGLAGARDRLLHAVEQARARFGSGAVWFYFRIGCAFAKEGESHAAFSLPEAARPEVSRLRRVGSNGLCL